MQRNFIEIQKAPSQVSQRAESPLDTLLSNTSGSLEEKKTITTKPFRKKRPEKRRHQSLLSLRLLRQHLFHQQQQQQQHQQQQEQVQTSSSDVLMGDLSFEQTFFGESPSSSPQEFKVLPLFSINHHQDNFGNQFQQETSGHFEVKKEDLNALLMEGMVSTQQQQNGIPILFDNRNQQDSFPNSFNGFSNLQQDNFGNFRIDSPELNFLRNEDLILSGRKRSSSAPPNGVQKPMSPLRNGSKSRSKRGRKPKVYDDMVLKFKLQ